MTFLSPEWAAAVRARATRPSFAAARSVLNAQADGYLAWLPGVPQHQAGYYHNYFCPQHAVQLVFDARSPQRHICPVDGADFSGEPFDSAWLWSVNDMLSDAALKLAFSAFVYQDVAGQERRVQESQQRASAILMEYATGYRNLPPVAGEQPRYPGHATFSVLDESVWIIRLTWAYAMSSGSLSTAEREEICEGLLLPAAAHIRRSRRQDIHNITNWNNAALATLALALSDSDLLSEAENGPAGLRKQLSEGVRSDGFWYEGSPSYHYYALAALVWHLRALRAAGRAFDDGSVLRCMLQAPIAIAFPDLTLPAIHDCWYAIGLRGAVGHGIPDAAGFYEIAYGWYGDPLFAGILQQNYARQPRSSFEALLDGAAALPQSTTPALDSYHAAGSGLAVLRSGAGVEQQSYLLLKAGPAVPGHGHPDQLSIQLFAHGERLSPDLGTPGYGIGLNNTWYRQTASHNTALVDGVSQPMANGHIDLFDTGSGNASLVAGSMSWPDGDGAGAHMQRIILWRAGYFIDAFFVECPAASCIDWVYHNLGVLTTAPAAIAASTDLIAGAYTYLSNVCRVHRRSGARLAWQRGRARLDLYLSPRGKAETYLGAGPANPASEEMSVVVRREIASRAAFVAVFALGIVDTAPYVRQVHWRRRGRTSLELTIDTAEGEQRWLVRPPRDGQVRDAIVRLDRNGGGGDRP